MTQKGLDDIEIGSRPEQVGGLAVTKDVRTASSESRDAGTVERAPGDGADGAWIREGERRGHGTKEHLVFIGRRPCLGDIGMQGIANILRQRESRLPARLSGDTDLGPVPVDVPEAQGGNVACPKRKPCEQK